MIRKKVTTSSLAIVMAAAIALSGTFAWQSISQQALNEARGFVNPGGRLHDDFSGPGGTKDIYVENFGAQPIYARVRLDEYMEIGAGAGTKDGATGNSTATSLVTGADIDDVTTWTIHIPGATSATTGEGTESPTWASAGETFHKYWTWTMGGQDATNNPDGKTVYLPTFNKNQDSLHADINGTLEGTTAGDGVHYDDYHAYAAGETKTAAAYYDADDNATDEDPTKPGNGGVQGTNYTAVNETHTAATTETAKVITMAEWKALPAAPSVPGSTAGNTKADIKAWVYDTDGWAYWSQPIAPKTATGLLLDKIAQTSATLDGEWYYAINAVGQFITADDLGKTNHTGFYTNGSAEPTADALTLLAEIGVTTTGTRIMDGSTPVTTLTMAPSDTKTLTVSAPAAATGSWTWTSSNTTDFTVTPGGTNNINCTVSVNAGAANGSSTTLTATNDNDASLTASVTITATVAAEDLKVGNTKILDGVSYTVVAVNSSLTGTDKNTYNAALLLSTNILETKAFDTNSPAWSGSDMQIYLNGSWLTNHSEAAAKAIQVPISTRATYNTTTKSTTNDKVFLLSEADLYGTSNYGADTSPQSWEYTYNGAKLAYFTSDSMKAATGGNNWYWLRSPALNSYKVARVLTDGTRVWDDYYDGNGGVRPAFWYNLAS